MGVPLLLTWLKTHYKRCFTSTLIQAASEEIATKTNKTQQATPTTKWHLHVDLNGLLYQSATLTLAELPMSTSTQVVEDTILKRLVELLDDLLFKRLADPLEAQGHGYVGLVFLALDGVSPMGKVSQQRFRRQTKRRRYDPRWDINAITSGTVFMNDRVGALVEWYAASRLVKLTQRYSKNTRQQQQQGSSSSSSPYTREVDFIVSDSSVPGEGEQKIIHFIRDDRYEALRTGFGGGRNEDDEAAALAARKECEEVRHVIASTDTDSIVAALTLHLPWVYVLRFHPDPVDTHCVSIRQLRCALYERLGSPEDTASFERALHDLTFILLLFGSDFLPALPWMEIAAGQLDSLLDYMRTDFVVRGKHLVDPTTHVLDVPNAVYFIQNLLASRPNFASSNAAATDVLLVGSKRPRDGLQIHLGGGDMGGAHNPFQGGGGNPKFGKSAGDDPTAGMTLGERQPADPKIITAYWEGLQWLLHYQGCSPTLHWRWYYPSSAVPTLEELCGPTTTVVVSDVALTKSRPLSPFLQLLLVLPKESTPLLPSCLERAYESVFLPLLEGKNFHQMDLSHLEKKVTSLRDLEMTNDEKLRAEPGQLYIFRLNSVARKARLAAIERGSKLPTPQPEGGEAENAAVMIQMVVPMSSAPTAGGVDDDSEDELPGFEDTSSEEDEEDAVPAGPAQVLASPRRQQATAGDAPAKVMTHLGLELELLSGDLKSVPCRDSASSKFLFPKDVNPPLGYDMFERWATIPGPGCYRVGATSATPQPEGGRSAALSPAVEGALVLDEEQVKRRAALAERFIHIGNPLLEMEDDDDADRIRAQQEETDSWEERQSKRRRVEEEIGSKNLASVRGEVERLMKQNQ